MSGAGSAPDTRSNSEYVLQELQPDNFWRCNDASGGLYDEITTAIASEIGSPVYEQAGIVSNEPHYLNFAF